MATASACEPRIDVYERFEEAREDWRALFLCAPSTPYQRYEYLSAWSDTLGQAKGLRPMIVVTRDAAGEALALLPLATRRVAGIRVAEFLGGRESNFNVALVRPGARIDFRRVLLAAARCLPAGLDLFCLRNQPRLLEGVENPLAALAASPSPSFAYGASLPADLDGLERSSSGRARKKLRSKVRRLSEAGEVILEHDARGARAETVISALVAQKSARLSGLGVGDNGFAAPQMRAFLLRLVHEGLLETHALSLSGRILATYVGLEHRGRFSLLANSFDMTEEWARLSPGEILLADLLRHCVSRGRSYVDLGIGEARYKSAVCRETIELHDSVLPATPGGALVAPLLRGCLAAKRCVKQSRAATRLIARARLLGARRS